MFRILAVIVLVLSGTISAGETPRLEWRDATPNTIQSGTVAATAGGVPIIINVEAPKSRDVLAPAPVAPEPTLFQQLLGVLNSTGGWVTLTFVGLYLFKLVADRQKWKVATWEGVIMHAFNEAEKTGIPEKVAPGFNAKLQAALDIFDTQFQKVFGTAPTAQQREIAKGDFAKKATALKIATAKAA